MDETSFLDHIVAHARVGSAIDALKAKPFRQQQRYALDQLKADLQRGESYVEEANRLGATDILTRLMKTCIDDEALLDDISHLISLCSGPMACAGRVLTLNYEGASVRIREGPLGDGLGVRVWAIAHVLCREMAAHPDLVRGLDVLEIGAGTGICGIVAAKLGAKLVVLTDNEPLVLQNLRTCMHLNSAAHGSSTDTGAGPRADAGGGKGAFGASDMGGMVGGGGGKMHGGGGGSGGGELQTSGGGFHGVTDEERFDDAESVDDIDFSAMVQGGGADGRGKHTAGPSQPGAAPVAAEGECRHGSDGLKEASAEAAWEADNMEVRLLDWRSSLEALHGAAAAAAAPHDVEAVAAGEAAVAAEKDGNGLSASGASDAQSPAQVPPGVAGDAVFPVILGNETMYEPEHATLVAAVIAQRLRPGGRAVLCSAVRFRKVFETFRRACASRGLRHRAVAVQPRPEDCTGGILKDDYDGGFVMIAVDWADHPAHDWHRDDFE